VKELFGDPGQDFNLSERAERNALQKAVDLSAEFNFETFEPPLHTRGDVLQRETVSDSRAIGFGNNEFDKRCSAEN